ncbi:MAG: quinoprotein relay system zinc metallohydrolase 2 [Granulosicoccus sp.]
MSRAYNLIFTLAVTVLYQSMPVKAADGIELSEVADGIYLYEGVHEQMSVANMGAIGNAGIIVGDRAVAVIDSGGSPEFGAIFKEAIARITDLPIDYLILTHFHPDHVAGSSAFPLTTHVVAHENHAQAMTQRAQLYLDRFDDLLQGSVQEIFRLPTTVVAAGQTLEIDLGSRTLIIEAHELAHTNNDITVHDQQTNTFWASDLLFSARTPSLDGSLRGWLDLLSELDERRYDLVVPGHGAPAAWSDLMKPLNDYLLQLRDHVKDRLDEGMSLSELLAIHDVGHTSSSMWALYAAQHGSNLAKAYTEFEWE